MIIFRFSVGSDAKSMAVPCVFAIGVVCWANFVWSKQKPSGKIIGLSLDDHWHSNRRVEYFFKVKFVEMLLKINWNLSHFDS